jgi:hypothetical protein
MTHKAPNSQDDGRAEGTTLARDFGLDEVRMAVKDIRYGEVRVVIQDGVIVQIERMEKKRLR